MGKGGRRVKVAREIRKGAEAGADLYDRVDQRQHERDMMDKELEMKRLELELARANAQRTGSIYLN